MASRTITIGVPDCRWVWHRHHPVPDMTIFAPDGKLIDRDALRSVGFGTGVKGLVVTVTVGP